MMQEEKQIKPFMTYFLCVMLTALLIIVSCGVGSGGAVVVDDTFWVYWYHPGTDTKGRPINIDGFEVAIDDSIVGTTKYNEWCFVGVEPGYHVISIRAVTHTGLVSDWHHSTDSTAAGGGFRILVVPGSDTI